MKAALNSPAIHGEPEEQLRSPLVTLVKALAKLAGLAGHDIQPDDWLPEYTTELLNVLRVLTRLVALEPRQNDLLGRIVDGPTLDADMLRASGALSDTSADGASAPDDAEA